MNPFETTTIFNSVLYDNVNKLNKNSEKLVIEGLKNIISIDDSSISLDNIMIKDALIKHLNSTNIEIRRLCSDLLLKMLPIDSVFLNDVLSIWLIRFIEEHSYNPDKLIYKKYVNLDNLADKVFVNLDWENNLLSALKTFTFLVKNTNDKKEKYKNMFITKIGCIKYTSNIILKYLFVIMENIGPIDELYDFIVTITIPTQITTKWRILFKIYKKIPPCINKDIKHIEIQVLEEMLQMHKIDNLEDCNVKNMSEFLTILDYCDNKIDFYKNNMHKINLDDFCIYRIVDDFNKIDKMFLEANEICKNVLKRHSLSKADKSEIIEYISDIDEINNIEFRYTENIICECKKSTLEIYKNIIDNLKYLLDDGKIYRGYLLGITFNGKCFDLNALKNLKYFADVFSKEDLSDFRDSISVIRKYPEEYTEEEIYNFVTIENYKEIIQVKELTPIVKRWIKTNVKNINTFDFKEFDLMFFCNGLSSVVRFIDYDELCCEYLKNIENISNLEIFEDDKFNQAVIKWLSVCHIPITLEFNDPYYTDIQYFYENIEISDVKNAEVKYLRDYYKKTLIDDLHILLYLICNAMLNIEDYKIRPKDITKLDLKDNNYFLYKVYKDLDCEYEEPFIRNPEIELLIEGKIDCIPLNYVNKRLNSYINDTVNNYTIKYEDVLSVIDSSNPKIKDQRILRGIISSPIYLYHISDKALEIYVDYLKDNFVFETCLGYLQTDIYWKRKLLIYDPIIKLICKNLASTLENNYLFVSNNMLSEDNDYFNFLVFDYPRDFDIFSSLFVQSLFYVKDLNLIFFIEKLLTKKEFFYDLYNKCTKDYQTKLSFLFPGIYRKHFKPNNVEIKSTFLDIQHRELISQYLKDESIDNKSDIERKFNMSSSGVKVSFKYKIEENDCECEIFYPWSYPLTCPVFTTNVEKKSLLNIKISKMLGRTSKYMEVIDLWRINVEKKSKGVLECYICYFILHIQDGTFPKFCCFHCEHKFHDKCIDKWIHEYKKSNCPLCRKSLILY